MRSLTVRLPRSLVADIEAESRRRRLSRSEVIRDRLQRPASTDGKNPVDSLAGLHDLIGSVNGLAPDLSARKKEYLKLTKYGQERAR